MASAPSLHGVPGRWRPWEAWAVIGLLALYVVLALTAVRRKSATFDEPYHVASGYGQWQTRDYQLVPQNGLPQEWATLALLPGSWAFPSLDRAPWSKAVAWHVGWHFLYEMGNDADALLFRARAMILVLAVALGLLVYAWSRCLFGPAGGLVSLTLFATCPSMLAHGPLVAVDLAAALFFSAAVGALWKLLHRVTPVTILLSSLAISALLLSKMTAVLIVPTSLLLAAFRLAVGEPWVLAWRGREVVVRGRIRQAMVLAGVAFVVTALVWAAIWAFFGFRYSAIRPGRPEGGYEYVQYWPTYLATPGMTMRGIGFARAHHLLPEAFLFSLADIVYQSGARVAFLNGENYTAGNVLYFPYCLLVKTSPVLFVLLAMAAAGIVRTRLRRTDNRAVGYAIAPVLLFLCVYWGFAFTSRVNIGHRHLLPIYPPLYIFAGGAALWLTRPAQRFGSSFAPSTDWRPRAVLGTCLLGAAAEAVVTWPHYLAYFNALAGGPAHGYRHLVDSSLDWGQDLKELARWLDENGFKKGSKPVYLSYFGTARPDYYGIRATTLPSYHPLKYPDKPAPLTGGIYCISATMLQRTYAFELFRSRWGQTQEVAYQQAVAGLMALDAAGSDGDAAQKVLKSFGVASRDEFRNLYEQARFARLCAALRRREPDTSIGCSILIYHLTDAEIGQALFGSPPDEATSA